MSNLTAAQRTDILARIAEIEAQLTVANATYLKLLGKDTSEYRFDSGEGSQRARRVELTDMKDQIDSLMAERDRLQRRLETGGLVTVNLRRN